MSHNLQLFKSSPQSRNPWTALGHAPFLSPAKPPLRAAKKYFTALRSSIIWSPSAGLLTMDARYPIPWPHTTFPTIMGKCFSRELAKGLSSAWTSLHLLQLRALLNSTMTSVVLLRLHLFLPWMQTMVVVALHWAIHSLPLTQTLCFLAPYVTTVTNCESVIRSRSPLERGRSFTRATTDGSSMHQLHELAVKYPFPGIPIFQNSSSLVAQTWSLSNSLR